MTSVSGSAQAALDFLNPYIGHWSYDRAAASNTRYGPVTPGHKFPTRSTYRISDCSGVLIRAAVEGGMARYQAGLPESSGDIARWAQGHPEQLLWSVRGGGRYGTLHEAIDRAPKFAWFVIGGYVNGDAGHIFAKWDQGHTVESASGLGGLRVGTFSRYYGRLAVTHALLPPVNFGLAPTAPTPPPQYVWVPTVEDDMIRISRIWYAQQQQLHSYWVKGQQLHHTWQGLDGGVGHENLSTKFNIKESLKPDATISVAVAPNQDMLVGCLAADDATIEFRWGFKSNAWGVRAFR